MFKVISPALVAVSLFAGGSYVLVSAQSDVAQLEANANVEAAQWLDSIRESAKLMEVELTPECAIALTEHIAKRGFKKAAVTNRGSVLVRDALGIDEWVCR